MYDGECEKQNKPILIIPAAGKSSRYPNMKPKWMLTHCSGELMIEKVIAGLNLKNYKKVYFVILKEHCEKYEADVILRQAFKDQDFFEITVLEESTNSSPETVFNFIKKNNINDHIVVKDCDCLVSYDPPQHKNYVVGLNLKYKNIKNLQQKSFIVCDHNNVIKEVVEKNVVSNFACLGVYAMHSSDLVKIFDRLNKQFNSEMYFSHVVSELIESGVSFLMSEASNFHDWGTREEWFDSEENKKTYFVDIDGVVLFNTGKYGSKNWYNTVDPIDDNVNTIKKLSDSGNELIFVTSRTEDALDLVKKFLEKENIKYKTIISGCLHSKRIIINDFAVSNPFPSCVAINLPRNSKIEPYI
jgi:hypothetical protein